MKNLWVIFLHEKNESDVIDTCNLLLRYSNIDIAVIIPDDFPDDYPETLLGLPIYDVSGFTNIWKDHKIRKLVVKPGSPIDSRIDSCFKTLSYVKIFRTTRTCSDELLIETFKRPIMKASVVKFNKQKPTLVVIKKELTLKHIICVIITACVSSILMTIAIWLLPLDDFLITLAIVIVVSVMIPTLAGITTLYTLKQLPKIPIGNCTAYNCYNDAFYKSHKGTWCNIHDAIIKDIRSDITHKGTEKEFEARTAEIFYRDTDIGHLQMWYSMLHKHRPNKFALASKLFCLIIKN